MAKIAIISTLEGSPWGGSEYLWATTAEEALNEGHEVFISLRDWSVDYPLVVQLQKRGAQLFPRPQSTSLSSKLLRKANQFLPFINSSYQPIFDCKPDIICISQSNTYDTTYYSNLLKLITSSSIPYLIICHLNQDTVFFSNNSNRSVAQKLLKDASRVLFVSKQNLQLAERQLAQSLHNAVVVKNPVNLIDHSLVDFPQKSIVSFAVVARLAVAHKGQDILFEALSSDVWKDRDWQCCLYGSGPDQAYLEALSHHYGITDRIKFMGHINNVRDIWADNHILVLSSRCEGTPLALVEAMLCARPAIVTDVGGNAEWVEEPDTGFIAEACTAKSFSAALERAWLGLDNWPLMGIKAHEYAKTKFDPYSGNSLLKLILNSTKYKLSS